MQKGSFFFIKFLKRKKEYILNITPKVTTITNQFSLQNVKLKKKKLIFSNSEMLAYLLLGYSARSTFIYFYRDQHLLM